LAEEYDEREEDDADEIKTEEKDEEKIRANYYITLKPEVILSSGHYIDTDTKAIFGIMYNISNADTAIYLDAKQILKENAYPKVSYTIKLSLANK